MKRINRVLGFCLIAFAAFNPVAAYSQGEKTTLEKPPLPAGPLLRNWLPKEAWTVMFEYSAAQAEQRGQPQNTAENNSGVQTDPTPRHFSESNKPAKMEITRFEPFFSIRFSGNRPEEQVSYYLLQDIFLINRSSSRSPVRQMSPALKDADELSPAEQHLMDLTAGKFLGFDWVAPQYYIGVQEIEGTPCLVFQKDNTQAWVDMVKRQPVLWMREGETRRFVQESPPTSPSIAEQAMRRMEGIMRSRERFNSPILRGGG